ncbi:Endoplasmic reticulum transmembrane protein 3 [Naganishia albida]|nr:Endoplasmic reticulum transmembrane protein 3 [Naganishia albida]
MDSSAILPTVCFGLLVSELMLFSAIVAPMPFKMKKAFLHFLSENPVVAKIQYGLKITFIFVAILFVDALQRMLKVAQEGQTAKQEKGIQDVRVETNHSARKFYAQRNLYLTGATLFLSLLLARVFYITLDLITVQDELNVLKGKTAKQSTVTKQGVDAQAELQRLQAQLEAKNRDLEQLKKQAGQNINAFNESVDAQNKTTAVTAKKDE